MKEYKVPIQSLIDHIKTAVDVDPWAKEMAEELLKEVQSAREEEQVGRGELFDAFRCCITDQKCMSQDCPYVNRCNIASGGKEQYVQIPKHLALDVLNQLKEQLPESKYRCARCGVTLGEGWRHCAFCGKEIDWDNLD